MPRRTARRTLTALFACGIALGSGAADALELLMPAYFYPSANPAQSQWDEMQSALAAGVAVTAIMNPDNGPGAARNADYVNAVDAFRAAGGRVLGYVYTCYGNNQCVEPQTRSAAAVVADAERYASWYAVDGIFLDEMGGSATSLPFYTEVSQALRASHAGWRLVGNPGTAIPEANADLVDTVVTFEQGRADYSQATSEPWMLTAPPQRQAHLHYNVGSEVQMRALLAEAVARRAGSVYITDDRYVPGDATQPNPFDQLPGYWAAEVAAVKALSAVPEPATTALWAAAVAAGLLIVRRRQRVQG